MRMMIAVVCVMLGSISPLLAVTLSRESDVTTIRLGQRVYVDDATCPTGQVKQITGKTLTAKGVAAVKQCVSRKSMHPN